MAAVAGRGACDHAGHPEQRAGSAQAPLRADRCVGPQARADGCPTRGLVEPPGRALRTKWA
eukprot:1334100-Alexandrium_andersonii.AAC.1